MQSSSYHKRIASRRRYRLWRHVTSRSGSATMRTPPDPARHGGARPTTTPKVLRFSIFLAFRLPSIFSEDALGAWMMAPASRGGGVTTAFRVWTRTEKSHCWRCDAGTASSLKKIHVGECQCLLGGFRAKRSHLCAVKPEYLPHQYPHLYSSTASSRPHRPLSVCIWVNDTMTGKGPSCRQHQQARERHFEVFLERRLTQSATWAAGSSSFRAPRLRQTGCRRGRSG